MTPLKSKLPFSLIPSTLPGPWAVVLTPADDFFLVFFAPAAADTVFVFLPVPLAPTGFLAALAFVSDAAVDAVTTASSTASSLAISFCAVDDFG